MVMYRGTRIMLCLSLLSFLFGCSLLGGLEPTSIAKLQGKSDRPTTMAVLWSRFERGGLRNWISIESRNASRTLDIEGAQDVRWLDPQTLLIMRRVLTQGDFIKELVVVSRSGESLEVFKDGSSATSQLRYEAVHRPTQRVLCVRRDMGNVVQGIEVLNLISMKLSTICDSGEFENSAGSLIWSPDGEWFSCYQMMPDPRNLKPKLAVFSIKSGRRVRNLPTENLTPRFWWKDHLYASARKGELVRYDTREWSSEEIYVPKKGNVVSQGVAPSDKGGNCLLLVRDMKLDPIEPYAKELHLVDVESGRLISRYRAPEGVLIAAADWIQEE